MFKFESQDERVQKLNYEDIPAILKIQEETNLSFWSGDDYARIIGSEEYRCLIIKRESRITGFISMRLIKSDYSVEIINIAVLPEMRKSGLGQKLFSEMLNSYLDNNLEAIFLEVRKSNLPAISFYKKNDFAVVGERRDFYRNPPENALIMRRDLKKA